MRFSYRILWVALAAVLFAAPALHAQAGLSETGPTQDKSRTSMLPESFSGWELSGTAQLGTDPRKLDGTSAAVLGENRFTDFEVATYKREDRTLVVKAARFADAEGAYATFTFYRQPLMRQEDIGTLAASLNERVLFFTGNIVVDAQFDHMTAMSGAQLRDLAARLPQAKGAIAELPTLPTHLPRKQLVPETARFVIGPAAFAALNLDISPELIDFSKSPKVIWARMNGDAPASAEILLVAYPTHIIAINKLSGFEHLAVPAGETSMTKRTGPIVALVRGNISRADAGRILDGVNYDANVTWNENSGQSKRDNIGNVVIAALTLAGILFLISVGAGAVFGFGRFLLPRMRAKKSGQGQDDGGMIRLNL